MPIGFPLSLSLSLCARVTQVYYASEKFSLAVSFVNRGKVGPFYANEKFEQTFFPLYFAM